MPRVVVMGVAGSGKSTIGERLAVRLGARFMDADAAHPPANIAKMAAGVPLTDEDRWPWLVRLRDELRRADNIVVTCSALKRRYRDVLREAGGTRFVFLDLDADTAFERAATRQHHFMGPAMIASQFEALERPALDETDVLTVDAAADVDAIIDVIIDAIGNSDDPS